MKIEIRKNVPLPESRSTGTVPPGRKKSKLRVAVEQLEVGDSFELGPYTSNELWCSKVAEKMRVKIIRCSVHHKRDSKEDVSHIKLATRLRKDQDNDQVYIGAWRIQ